MINILVVEDDKHTRKLLETILKREGYSVLKAEDGVIAMEVLENNHVDLIILDIMMPNMDGYEFAKELRDAECMIPILMATAKQLPEEVFRKECSTVIDNHLGISETENQIKTAVESLLSLY